MAKAKRKAVAVRNLRTRRPEPPAPNMLAVYFSLVDQIKGQFAQSFLANIKAAISSHDEIVSKAYLAWRLAQRVECREAAEEAIKGVGMRGFDSKRFIEFLMFAASAEEKVYIRRFRDYMISVFQELDRRIETKEWRLPAETKVETVESKIATLGGVPVIHQRWLKIKQHLARQKAQNKDAEQDKQRGVPEGTTAQERLEDLQKRTEVRYAQRKEKFYDLMTNVCEKVSNTGRDGIYVRTTNGDLLKLNAEEERRVVASRT